jgi:hypothetical protein
MVLFFRGELGMTKVLFDEAADKGVAALEPTGLYETAGGGAGACGRLGAVVKDADGPPNKEGKVFVLICPAACAAGVEG